MTAPVPDAPPVPDALPVVSAGAEATPPRPTPAQIAAAWRAFRGDRRGMLLGPGPGFVEAIGAAMALDPRVAGDIAAEIVAEHVRRGHDEGEKNG